MTLAIVSGCRQCSQAFLLRGIPSQLCTFSQTLNQMLAIPSAARMLGRVPAAMFWYKKPFILSHEDLHNRKVNLGVQCTVSCRLW